MSVAPVPPQISDHMPEASAGGEDLLGVRIAAALIDLALLSALFAILAATIGESTVEEGMFSFALDGLGPAVYLALVFVYYVGFELALGPTVGKLLLSVRVVRTGGGRPSVVAITVRTLLRVVDWLPALYLVGFITMLATGARRQRLGDLAARSRGAGAPDTAPGSCSRCRGRRAGDSCGGVHVPRDPVTTRRNRPHAALPLDTTSQPTQAVAVIAGRRPGLRRGPAGRRLVTVLKGQAPGALPTGNHRAKGR